jgi:5-methylcytosine-specific restriction endonuclease McrA
MPNQYTQLPFAPQTVQLDERAKRAAYLREYKRKRRREKNPEWYEQRTEHQRLKADGFQICSACREVKPFDAFSLLKNGKRHRYCKECASTQAKQSRENRGEEYHVENRARVRAWGKLHPESLRARQLRRRAQVKNATIVPFTRTQFLAKFAYWGNRCWICGDAATAADHVKPIAKGGLHTLANIRPICKPCNSTKNARWPFPLVRNIPRW